MRARGMGCFSCGSAYQRDARRKMATSRIPHSPPRLIDSTELEKLSPSPAAGGENRINAHSFTFQELAAATKNFKESNLIGEGGFGKVYKGHLNSGQVVAIKQLNPDGLQGTHEFLVEVLMLIMLHHPNLVSLIGYCHERDERLLVYEYMPQGSLENHLFDLPPGKEPLDWNTRIKIAAGAAKGLTYLHDVVNPPVIYRDLKSSNILLDDDFNPKLSDFGLAKLGPVGDNTHVSTRVMGTYGYCAPDYATSGKLTVKADVYSFGVVLLELITGQKAFDLSKEPGERNLIKRLHPFLNDKTKFTQLADPLLRGHYPPRAFYQLAVIASMCLHERAHIRPTMHDVAVALDHVASQPHISETKRRIRSSPPSSPLPLPSPRTGSAPEASVSDGLKGQSFPSL